MLEKVSAALIFSSAPMMRDVEMCTTKIPKRVQGAVIIAQGLAVCSAVQILAARLID